MTADPGDRRGEALELIRDLLDNLDGSPRTATLRNRARAFLAAGDSAQELVWCDTHNPAGTETSPATRHTLTQDCRNAHNAGHRGL